MKLKVIELDRKWIKNSNSNNLKHNFETWNEKKSYEINYDKTSID